MTNSISEVNRGRREIRDNLIKAAAILEVLGVVLVLIAFSLASSHAPGMTAAAYAVMVPGSLAMVLGLVMLMVAGNVDIKKTTVRRSETKGLYNSESGAYREPITDKELKRETKHCIEIQDLAVLESD